MFTFLVDIFILKNDFHTGTFDKLIFDTLDVICLLNQWVSCGYERMRNYNNKRLSLFGLLAMVCAYAHVKLLNIDI